MIEISLLPVDEQAKPKRSSQKGLGFTVPKFIPRGFAIAFVVLLAMFAVSYLRASSLSKNLTNSRLTLTELQKDSGEASIIEAKLGPPPGTAEKVEKGPGGAEAPKDSGERLRQRAAMFETHLENRNVWSRMLQEITLCCPEEIRLTGIKLVALRAGVAGQEAKELVISGFYVTGANPEMILRQRLWGNKIIAAHYKNFIPMTQPEPERTLFWIHCREQ